MLKWIYDSIACLRELRDKLDKKPIFKHGFHAEIAIVVYSKETGNLVTSFYKMSDESGFMDPVISVNCPL